MSRDVATFVIGVDGEVQTHKFNKVLVAFEAQELREVVRVVLVGFNFGQLAILVDVAVDASSNLGQLGNQVHSVLKGRLPVLGLVDTLRVGLCKDGVVLEGVDGQGELGHGVESLGAAVDKFFNKFRDGRASSPLGRESLDLLLGGDFTGDEQPEERLGKRLLTTISSGKQLLAFGDGQTTEADTFLRVQDGTFPDKTLDATHTTIGHVDGDFTENLVAIFLAESLDFGLLLGDQLGKTLLQGLFRATITVSKVLQACWIKCFALPSLERSRREQRWRRRSEEEFGGQHPSIYLHEQPLRTMTRVRQQKVIELFTLSVEKARSADICDKRS